MPSRKQPTPPEPAGVSRGPAGEPPATAVTPPGTPGRPRGPTDRPPADPLASFHPVVRAWFLERFGAPSPPQALGWPLIAQGRHCLITAPTGSGKTLAAFLKCLDALWQEGNPEPGGVRVLYVSPLKALGVDIEKNLQEPLQGVLEKARAMGVALPELRVAVRTGDTDTRDRARMLRRPPHVLITTPESLYLILTSRRAREMLRTVRYVIVDELHALLGTKRGAHLSLSLERLEALCPEPPVRIGLTATVRPLERAARFLGGQGPDGAPRPVAVADAGLRKGLDLRVEVPVPEMGALPDDSIWPAIDRRLAELVRAHRSTLIFVNSRRLAERLAARLGELLGPDRVRTHHGSLSREQRRQVEEELKSGRLPCLVATGTLELGIDVGAIDLVVQVESPRSVARGLQRVGRAGHLLGAASKGRILPKYRGDLLEAAAVARGMLRGEVEEFRVPECPLDVLAQQIVAMAAVEEWREEDLLALVRRAYPYRHLSRRQFELVLGMLAGRYSETGFTELRPRIAWDRVNGVIRGREGSQVLAVRSGGTIPDRGLYGVYLAGTDVKLGEIDEEFAFETHPGEVFLFGTQTWRTERVTHDRIEVTPAPGVAHARLPFWRGETPGRPTALGRKVGALCREVAARLDDPELLRWLEEECALDPRAAANLRNYLWDLQEHLGAVPTDRHLVAEWFPEELGGWRLLIYSPFGGPLHAAWALALRRKYRQWLGTEIQVAWSDDGLMLRLPPVEPGAGVQAPEAPGEGAQSSPVPGGLPTSGGVQGAADPLAPIRSMTPEEAEELLLAELGDSAMFGAAFRMAAERALLLPRHGRGRRTPLWLQRQKSKDLLEAVRGHGDFPILLEAYRECLEEVLDLPGLQEVLRGIQSGAIALTGRQTPGPSPAAAGLLWNFTAAHLYEDDTPRAERAAATLALDRGLLLELVGSGRLRELLDPRALAEVEARLQHTHPALRARDPDGLHDLLLRLGDLTPAELRERADPPEEADRWLKALAAAGRAVPVTLGGEVRWVAAEEAAIYAAAAAGDGTARERLLRRYARTHGPFTLDRVAGRFGWPAAEVRERLAVLAAAGELVAGGFTPGGDEPEWCDPAVLDRIRRATLALLRREVEPRSPGEYARFLLRHQGVAAPGSLPGGGARRGGGGPAGGGLVADRTGLEGLRRTLYQLRGLFLPAAAWEEVLPRRVAGYEPLWLDQLLASGEFLWVGKGGKVAFLIPGEPPPVPLSVPGGELSPVPPPGGEPAAGVAEEGAEEHPNLSPGARQVLAALRRRGASFLGPLAAAAGLTPPEALAALWELVWAGLVTNDTFAPLREHLRLRGAGRGAGAPAGGSRRQLRAGLGPSVAGGTGRWSLVAESLGLPGFGTMAPGPGASGSGAAADAGAREARVEAQVAALLDRYGVVAREMAVAEGMAWSELYPVLQRLELRGEVRRGYFIAGLSGAQFARPQVVDRLRAEDLRAADRDDRPAPPEVAVLPALDPANPWGLILPLPPAAEGRFRLVRAPGNYLVVWDGEPVLAVEGEGRRLVPLTTLTPERLPGALAALRQLLEPVGRGRARRRVEVERWGDRPVTESPVAEALLAAGFERGYRRFVLYPG